MLRASCLRLAPHAQPAAFARPLLSTSSSASRPRFPAAAMPGGGASSSRPRSAAAAMPGGPSSTPPKVLVPIGDGSEEMEAVIIIDLLRRAGAAVTVASVEPGRNTVVCSRGVKIEADASIDDPAVKAAQDSWDAVALPGGMPGAERLRDCLPLTDAVESAQRRGAVWAAICASPAVAWAPRGWLAGRAATAHPAFMEVLATAAPGGPACNARASEGRVVVDGTLITSRGPGTAFEFGLALVAALCGEEKAAEVAGPLVLPK